MEKSYKIGKYEKMKTVKEEKMKIYIYISYKLLKKIILIKI